MGLRVGEKERSRRGCSGTFEGKFGIHEWIVHLNCIILTNKNVVSSTIYIVFYLACENG